VKISKHTHPRYIVWLKYFVVISAFILLLDFLYTEFVTYSRSGSIVLAVLNVLIAIFLCSIPFLIVVYFLGQNITVTDDGLLVEFLWKDLNVPWDKIIEIKPAFGFWRSPQDTKNTCIVLTNALTPFHRLLGLIYGPSVRPAFIISPTISEYHSLVETIKNHTKKR